MPIMDLIYYKKEGAGKPIIFLHGQGLNGTIFSNTIKSLGEYTSYALDLRGHGKNKAEKKVSFEKYLNDILQVMKKEKISKATIVGHSFGSFLALHFAKKYPERVSQLILVDEVHRISIRTIKGSFILLAIPLFKVIDVILRIIHKRYSNIDFSKHEKTSFIKLIFLSEKSKRIFTLENTVPAMMDNAFLASIKTPTLIIEPVHDQVMNKFSYCEITSKLPNSTCINVSGGHYFPIRYPKKLAKIIKKYVK